MKTLTLSQLEELQYSDDYAEFIMKHGNNSERSICNGDKLLLAQEDGYMFEEFVTSLGYDISKV